VQSNVLVAASDIDHADVHFAQSSYDVEKIIQNVFGEVCLDV